MDYNKEGIKVAVPEEIRRVPRPKNTVVCLNGNGINKYVVQTERDSGQ